MWATIGTEVNVTGLLPLKNRNGLCALASVNTTQARQAVASAGEGPPAFRNPYPGCHLGAPCGSAGTQSAVRVLFSLFGVYNVHEGLLDGEVRRQAAFVHTDVFTHEVKRGAVVATDRAAVHECP